MISDNYIRYNIEDCRNCKFHNCEFEFEYQNETNNSHNKPLPPANKSCITLLATTVMDSDSELDKNTITIEVYPSSELPKSSGKELLENTQCFGSVCIMSPKNVIQVECGIKNVTDGIGEHYKVETGYNYKIEANSIDRWEPIQPVFICAQTGRGKNYFIEHALLPYVRELNYRKKTDQRVLILSNRLALKQQIKNRIPGEDASDGENGTIYSYGKFADVMTYQSLLKKYGLLKRRQKKALSRYIYVICDEAHYFTSDAMFNPHTQKILSTIVQLFQDAIRVYMSATPYECLEYIIKCEESYKDLYLNWNKPQHKCKYGKMVLYHFQSDYNYLNIKYYNRVEELYKEIVISVNKKHEKWLIFIDDKEKCTTVMKALEQYGHIGDMDDSNAKNSIVGKILAVDATSKEDESYRAMILNEKLGKNIYVLISTSVLDNGVNLRGINNIVISDMARVKCLQMVGRARVSNSDERKTLYIRRFDSNYVEKRIWDLEKQKDAYHSYEMAYDETGNGLYPRGYSGLTFLEKYYNGDERDWGNAKHWFGISPTESPTIYLNEIAKSLLEKLIPQYQFILKDMEDESEQKGDTESERRIGQKYLEHQLSWFGKQYSIDNDVNFVEKKKEERDFIAFLNSYADSKKQINQESQEAFKAEFTRMYDNAFQRADPNLTRKYNINKMNKLLQRQGICYKVDSRSSYWLVITHKWDSENSEL